MASDTIKRTSFVVRSITVSYTAAAGSSAIANLKTLIDADLPAGFNCLGIVGFTSNSSVCTFSSVRYVDSNYAMQIRNMGTSQISETARIYYLASNI